MWWAPLLGAAMQQQQTGHAELTPGMLGGMVGGTAGDVLGAVENPLGAAADAAGLGGVLGAVSDPESAILDAAITRATGAPEPQQPEPEPAAAPSYPGREGMTAPELPASAAAAPMPAVAPAAIEPTAHAEQAALPTTPEGMPRSMADAWQELQTATRAGAEADRNKAQAAADALDQQAQQVSEQAIANKAAWIDQEREKANIAQAQAGLKQVEETKIDPLRVWSDAPWYGKALAVVLFGAADPRSLGPLTKLLSTYMQNDIRAQQHDKDSSLNTFTKLLGDARAGKKAAELKMQQGLLDEVRASKLAGMSDEMKAGLDKFASDAEQGLAKGKLELVQMLKERQDKIDYQNAQLEQGQQRIDQGARGLDLQARGVALQERRAASQEAAAAAAASDRQRQMEMMQSLLKPTEAKAEGIKQAAMEVAYPGMKPAQREQQWQKFNKDVNTIDAGDFSVSEALKAIEQYRQSGEVPGQGWWPEFSREYLGGSFRMDNDEAEVVNKIGTALFDKIKSDSGAAFTEAELARREQILLGSRSFDSLNANLRQMQALNEAKKGAIYGSNPVVGRAREAMMQLSAQQRGQDNADAPTGSIPDEPEPTVPDDDGSREETQRYLRSIGAL